MTKSAGITNRLSHLPAKKMAVGPSAPPITEIPLSKSILVFPSLPAAPDTRQQHFP